MPIDHVLAVIPVADLTVSADWYERLFDAVPTNRPMPNLAEWRLTDTGWVRVFVDGERAGGSFFNLAVSELDEHLRGLRGRGFALGEVQEATKGVRISTIEDPDGNTLNFIGGFRVVY
jgi:predicted enzyme related to lactoylglutathione lyase